MRQGGGKNEVGEKEEQKMTRTGTLPGNTHRVLSPEQTGKGQWAKQGGMGKKREKRWIDGSHRDRDRGEHLESGRIDRCTAAIYPAAPA